MTLLNSDTVPCKSTFLRNNNISVKFTGFTAGLVKPFNRVGDYAQ